jgi:hypothetical protein
LDAKTQINEVLAAAAEDVKTVVSEVLRIENNYIHMNQPRGINDDILNMIERVVK